MWNGKYFWDSFSDFQEIFLSWQNKTMATEYTQIQILMNVAPYPLPSENFLNRIIPVLRQENFMKKYNAINGEQYLPIRVACSRFVNR